MFLISDLCTMLNTYLEEDEVKEVYRAYLFGAEAHAGQKRMSGEPYIYHPLAVARILAGLKLDHKTLMAAILHDVIEDTEYAKEQLAIEFDDEVATLVDGVSKLTQIKFESKAEAQAENFRKLMLAMAKDVRVILIKLADRVHNMRTIGIMRPEKKRRIAKETLDIFVPIAHRLGINSMRIELEELGFEAAYPLRHKILQDSIAKISGNRKEIINKIEVVVKSRLEEEDLHCQIIGREKHLYSVYNKMKNKRLSFADVYDVYAFRIVVDKIDTCYRVMGMLHNLYKPLPGRFKDYIAIPKINGYQSLHTVLFGPYGVPIEVQIRTEEMDKIAEAGIAAHWLYKQGSSAHPSPQNSASEWLRSLLEMQQTSGNSFEFLEHVKMDLFPDVVYVFTPKGEIKELQRGSTAIDFAYSVHSDIGNKCVAVKIDRQLSPLRTQLETGQTVEILTAPGAKPSPAWLNFVVSGRARTHIRHYLKSLQTSEAISLGARLLDRSLGIYAMSINGLPQSHKDATVKNFNLKSFDDLLSEIGLGNRMPALVAKQLVQQMPEHARPAKKKTRGGQFNIKGLLSKYAPSWLKPSDEQQPTPLSIRGTEGVVVNYAKCCHPIPGDSIVGIFSAGKGVVIHTVNCKNVKDYKKHPENILELQWEEKPTGDFPVEVRVEVSNQRGVLATIAARIAEQEANIENISLDDKDHRYTDLVFLISVKNRKHLADVMRHIKLVDKVTRITRTKG